jgi:hypothetical protein
MSNRKTKKTVTAPAHDTAPLQFSRGFDERLLNACLSVHPLASVMPNKEKHVIAAVKATSAPQIFVKNGADSKNKGNNKEKNNKDN